MLLAQLIGGGLRDRGRVQTACSAHAFLLTPLSKSSCPHVIIESQNALGCKGPLEVI